MRTVRIVYPEPRDGTHLTPMDTLFIQTILIRAMAGVSYVDSVDSLLSKMTRGIKDNVAIYEAKWLPLIGPIRQRKVYPS